MRARRALVAGAACAVLLTAGGVGAHALMDLPQDATPASPDPIGDILRTTTPTAPVPAPGTAPVETAPTGEPAPARPVAVTPADPVVVAQVEEKAEAALEEEAEEPAVEKAPEEPRTPGRRQRRPVAVIQAIDKITAETMRFEVQVGGRPVRFNKALLFSVRACEVSAADEQTEDAIAYLDVALQPRGAVAGTEPRQIFRGWMFASSPSVNGLQHPIYDAWVVGCKG